MSSKFIELNLCLIDYIIDYITISVYELCNILSQFATLSPFLPHPILLNS